MDKERKFPAGFLWGAATSSHQVEGGNRNDWSEWERQNAERLSRESGGTYPPENYISGRACDHYNRYEEDFDIAKSLGHNAHRFSIEWSRIEPEEGKFDQTEIEHYRAVIKALRIRGMEPFVTLWHWTLPLWLRDKGGVASREFPEFFARYAERMASEYKDDVRFWITINEPMVYVAYGYIAAIRPPQISSIWFAYRAVRNLVRAHTAAYTVFHDMYQLPHLCCVGIAKHDKYFVAMGNKLKNRIIVTLVAYVWNDYFMRRIQGAQDFVGLNYYNKNSIDFSWNAPRKGLYNLTVSSDGFYHSIMRLRRYAKPIYILENGLDDASDKERPQFIREHVDSVQRAIHDSADVCGYFHWSLMDNFEWENGFWPRFGIVEIDYATLERRVRPSGWEYKKIIEGNTLS